MAENEGVIRQQLGFDASQAIAELSRLNASFTTLGSQLTGLGSQLSAFNANAAQTVASLRELAAAASATMGSVTKAASVASTPAKNLDAALGVNKVTDSIKAMHDAARLGTGTYSNAMSSMASQTKTAATTIADANAKTKEWVVSWNTLSRVVMTQFIVRALSMIRDAFRESYQSALEFSKAVSEIKAINPERNFQEIAANVRELSDAFNQPLSRMAEAQYQVISDQFVKAADQANILTAANALAKVGADDLAASAQLLTGALNAYGESSEMASLRAAQFFTSVNLGRFRMSELGTAMGRVQSIGNSLGVSMEELQAALISITIGGVKSNEAATQLRSAMTALMKPSEAMKAALNEIGVESGEAAIKTWGFHGAWEKVRATTDGSAAAMGKLVPNVRGVAGVLRLLEQGATAYKEALEELNKQDFSTLNKQLKDFMDTDAEKLTKELNKLANFFTVEFGLELISTLNKLINLIGGGNGLIGVFRSLASVPLDALILGAALAFGTLFKSLEMTTVGFARVRRGIQLTKFEIMSLRGVLSTLALIELGKMIGNQIGEMIIEAGNATGKALREQLDAELKMHQEQSAAKVRQKQGEAKEVIQVLRQHFADANKEYLKDVANYKTAVKAQIESVKDAFDKIMSMRNKLTQELGAAAEAAAKKAAQNAQQVAEIQHQIADRTFNAKIDQQNLSPDWQFRMYSERMRQLGEQAAKLQANAKDGDQQKLADEAWRRADAYAQMAEQAAKQTGNTAIQRQSTQQLNYLDNLRVRSLNQQAQAAKKVSDELEKQQRQAQQHNAELERERDVIEDKLSAFQKGDKGELTEKTNEQWKKDLGEAQVLIDAWVEKVKTTTKGDFLKNLLGDAKALESMKRDAERLLSSVHLKELQAAPEALAKLRDQLQDSLNKAGLTADVIVNIENFTGKEVITHGLEEVLKEFETKWNEIIANGVARTKAAADQASLQKKLSETQGELDKTLEPMPYKDSTPSGWWAGEDMNTARTRIKSVVDEIANVAKNGEFTSEKIQELRAKLEELGTSGALNHAFAPLDSNKQKVADLTALLAQLFTQLQEAQGKMPKEVPATQQQEAEAIRQQIEGIKQKKSAQSEAAQQMEREKQAALEGKTAIDAQFQSVGNGLSSVAALETQWWGVEAAASAAAQAAAAAALAGSGGFEFSGMETTVAALGGLIRGFHVGGFVPRGTDTVPAMLTPGEYVMNAGATRRWYSHLVAMNSGLSPAFRSQGGNVSNVTVGDININGSAQPRDTAREVIKSLKRELRRGTSVLS